MRWRAIDGEGHAEFTVPASPGYAMFGLSHGDTDRNYSDVDYAFYTYALTGQLMIYESGTYRGMSGAHSADEKHRITVESGLVP